MPTSPGPINRHGTLPEHTPKQASHTMPTTEEVKHWNVDELIKWIQRQEPKVLPDDKVENFEKVNFAGRAFLAKAGKAEFFEEKLGLSMGDSIALADLALEIKEEETAGIKRNRQQAKDVEMSDAADMKSPRKVQDDFKAGIKYQPPHPLLGTSGLDWVFQPHPELHGIIASNVLEHYTQYKINRVDKSYAPIYFYLGGAGTGKSRHGSEFASSAQEAIRLHAELHAELHTDHDLCDLCDLCHELVQRLEKAFVFHVSFENGTSLTHEERSEPWNAVGVRMLYQLLGGDIEDISSKYIATPRDVFRLVATAENVDLYNDFTGILVVDGIQRANQWDSERKEKESVFYGFLSQIGDLSLMSRYVPKTEEGKLRRTPFIMTCVTATYFGPAEQYLADTHRKRVYLPLNRLDVPTWKDSDEEVLNDDPGTRLLLDDVGGHARAIEVIAEELAQYRNGAQPNISELATGVLIRLKNRYSEVASMMGDDLIPVVQCILSRKPIRFQGFIPGSDKRWERIIAKGLLWFEKIEDSGTEYLFNPLGYIVAPYIWLWLFARLLPANNTDRLAQFIRAWDFNDYGYLLHLKTGIGYTGKVTWQTFEAFCCYFRILRSLGFENEQEVLFKELHSGCKLRDDNNTIVVNRQLDYGEATHQHSTEATLATDVVTKHAGTLDTEKLLYFVTLNGHSAPAGDFFFNIETRARRSSPFWRFEGGIVREVGQSKFVKKLDKETYNKERNKSADPTDFFILYATAETPDDIDLPDRSGIVDESCWASYFGPFAGRAFMASRYARSQVEES